MAKNPCKYYLKDGRVLSYDEMRQYLLENYETVFAAANPPKPPKAAIEVTQEDADDMVGIKHAETAQVRNRFQLPEYEKQKITDEEVDAEAEALLRKGYNIDALIKRMENGEQPSAVEYNLFNRYLAILEKKVATNPSAENLSELKRAVQASDTVGSIQGRSFRQRRLLKMADDSLASYFLRQMEETGVDTLTEAQISQNTKEFNEIKAANEALQKKLAELQQEINELLAKDTIKKVSRSKQQRKSHEEYTAQRKKIVDDMREKLRKARGETSAVVVPYAKELIAIAPDVTKLVASYVEEGVVELAEMTKRIYDDLKPAIPELTEGDVTALIAGEYSQPKKTKNELLAQRNALKKEAELVRQLEKLEAGEEPSSEVKRIERNQQLAEMRKKVKEHDLSRLAERKKQLKRNIEDLEQQLKTGDFVDESVKPKLKLDAEAKELKRKLVRLQTDREVRLLKERYEKRSRFQKAIDKLLQVLNIPRSLMASADFSALLLQAPIATIANPKMAKNAAIEMFKSAWSQDKFDEWFYDLKDDPRYELMTDLRLGIADPTSPFLVAKEEAFMSGYAERIPFVGRAVKIPFTDKKIGGLVKGSERAYVMYLNKMRVDLFNRYADQFEADGKTFETDPDLYKKMAQYVNNMTGRGGMGKSLENYAPFFSAIFFSPRLIAARLNLLNPVYGTVYLPKELRKEYWKDMLLFIATGLTTLGLLYAAYGSDDEDEGIQIETDPRSSDFMKIKSGKTRWDIWGGFQPYVRVIAQVVTGQRKSTTTDEIIELDGEGAFGTNVGDVVGSFIRNKLSPSASIAVNFISGRTSTGERFSWEETAKQSFVPLIFTGVKEAMEDDGVKALFTVGLPSIFGISAQTYSDKPREVSNTLSVNGVKVKLSSEQHEQLEAAVNAQTEKAIAKLETLPEYKSASKKERKELETIAKRIALTKAKDDFKKKYKSLFIESPQQKREREQKERAAKAVGSKLK